MDAVPPTMPRRKQLALIAHDNRKADMLEWARYNRGTLSQHELHATGTTGAKLASIRRHFRARASVVIARGTWTISSVAWPFRGVDRFKLGGHGRLIRGGFASDLSSSG